MKVLINASVLRGPRTGIGHYTWELARELAGRPEIEPLFFDGLFVRDHLTTMGGSNPTRRFDWIKQWIPMAYPMRRLVMQHRFDALSRKSIPDIYHEPSLWPLDSRVPSVVTLHDLTHIHYPQTQPRKRLEEIERHCATGLKQAGCVLVDSEFIAREVVAHYGVPTNKIVVAPLGVSGRFKPRSKDDVAPSLKKLELEYGRFILSVGTLEPRKNLAFTLRAHGRLPQSLQLRYPLVLVGMTGWHYSRFSKEIESGLAKGSIRMTGYLDDESVSHLLCGARMLVYPSLYEGFGLPVAEAMASGLPVIASKQGAIPEVAGSAAVYVDLDDDRGYALAMVRLIEDENEWQGMRKAGLKRAAQFTWRRCAEKTVGAYHHALGR